MKKYILTVTLNPALDRIEETTANSKSNMIRFFAGGKGLNVARTLTCLKMNVLATGILGGSNGKKINELLRKERIKNDFFFSEKQTRENRTYLDKNGKIVKRAVKKGIKIPEIEIELFIQKFRALLKHAQMVVLSGRKPFGADEEIYARLILLAKRRSLEVVLDTSGEPLRRAIKAKPAFIKPNLEELEAIFGRSIISVGGIVKALHKLYQLGVKSAVCTMGGEGCIGFNGEEIWHVKPPSIKITNDLGCGDAFVGGYVSSYASRKKFKDCLSYATACATVSACQLTPGLTEIKKILKLQNRLIIKPILTV